MYFVDEPADITQNGLQNFEHEYNGLAIFTFRYLLREREFPLSKTHKLAPHY
jgi:hypothetical protein